MNKPDFTISDVLDSCMEDMNISRKKMFSQAKSDFVKYSEIFDEFMMKKIIYQLDENYKSSFVKSSDAKNLYEYYLLKKEKKARKYYNTIQNSAPDGICPLCLARPADTVDHYMPKAIYSFLVVNPLNLVPLCGNCNKNKLDMVPSKESEMFLHPYYDDIDTEWLQVKINRLPTDITYFVDKEAINYNRIQFCFEKLKWNQTFKIYTTVHLRTRKNSLKNIYQKNGYDELKKSLLDEYESKKGYNLNYWQTALYYGLSNAKEEVFFEWFNSTN